MGKRNYGWFYQLLRQSPEIDKESVVQVYTDGRTTHLHEMRDAEYREMCIALEDGSRGTDEAKNRELRKARSSALLRIGRLGISTIDNWDGINAFCMSPKIAGKEFGRLSVGELRSLVSKLEAIIRRGGIKTIEDEEDDNVKAALSFAERINPTNKYLS